MEKQQNQIKNGGHTQAQSVTLNGYRKGLTWKEIRPDYDLPAELDIMRRSGIYAESNEVEN